MKWITKDESMGDLFLCDCGKKVYSHFGQAKRHRETCPKAKQISATKSMKN